MDNVCNRRLFYFPAKDDVLQLSSKLYVESSTPSPESVRTDGRLYVRGDVITRFSRVDGLSIFFTHGAFSGALRTQRHRYNLCCHLLWWFTC